MTPPKTCHVVRAVRTNLLLFPFWNVTPKYQICTWRVVQKGWTHFLRSRPFPCSPRSSGQGEKNPFRTTRKRLETRPVEEEKSSTRMEIRHVCDMIPWINTRVKRAHFCTKKILCEHDPRTAFSPWICISVQHNFNNDVFCAMLLHITWHSRDALPPCFPQFF